jgi:uncharacterized protein (DUF952 family)
MIYHITTHKDWEKAKMENAYSAPSLQTEGFIHCSTLKQITDTANIFFKGQTGLAILCIDERKLKPEVKFEDPTGGGKHDPHVGNLFPHVYGPVNLSSVIQVYDFPPDEKGFFSLPERMGE